MTAVHLNPQQQLPPTNLSNTKKSYHLTLFIMTVLSSLFLGAWLIFSFSDLTLGLGLLMFPISVAFVFGCLSLIQYNRNPYSETPSALNTATSKTPLMSLELATHILSKAPFQDQPYQEYHAFYSPTLCMVFLNCWGDREKNIPNKLYGYAPTLENQNMIELSAIDGYCMAMGSIEVLTIVGSNPLFPKIKLSLDWGYDSHYLPHDSDEYINRLIPEINDTSAIKISIQDIKKRYYESMLQYIQSTPVSVPGVDKLILSYANEGQ